MELIKGTIYKYIYTNQYLISECTESNTKKVIGYLCIEHNNKAYRTWNNVCSGATSVVLATEEEKQWYLACKKANKFIEKEEALKSLKQETKFIIGQWYLFDNNTYIKISSNIIKHDCIEVSEKIISGKFEILNQNHNKQFHITRIKKEIPLSEIQAYLPEGHVDKIKKEEPIDLIAEAKRRYPVGSKFKCPNGNKSQYEANYNKEDDTWTVTTYKIIRIEGQDCVHSGNGYLHFKGKWAIIISEAKQPEEEKWKIGGWVKCIKDYCSCRTGEFYQITEHLKGDCRVNVKTNIGTAWLNYVGHNPIECEWVGMSKPSWYKEQQEQAQQQWSSWGITNHLGYLGTKGDEKPVEKEQLYNVTIKKSKVQQVKVVPLQKPCIISTRKSKLNLIKL